MFQISHNIDCLERRKKIIQGQRTSTVIFHFNTLDTYTEKDGVKYPGKTQLYSID